MNCLNVSNFFLTTQASGGNMRLDGMSIQLQIPQKFENVVHASTRCRGCWHILFSQNRAQ